jgi:hypothetical protein
MSLLSKESRRLQSVAEMDALLAELEKWYLNWTERDVHEDGSLRGQYRTQLQAVHSEVKGAALGLRKSVADTSIDGDARAVYGEFARADREILWLWRAWYFFRDKFQQREDPRFADILSAADEVVWSCHRPFFPAQVNQVAMPAPLPYIKAEFSPSALRQDQKQALDRKDNDFLIVKEAFRNLPVPILAMPITVVNNPWALVLIGHEEGHIVEPLMEQDFNITFRAVLQDAVQQAGGSEEDQQVWSAWGDEIFADLYSVLTMGPWAVWAIAQFEAADDQASAERRFVYPAPCVRLQLMAALVQQYGLTVEIPGAPAVLPEETLRDTGYVDGVARAIVAIPRVQALAASLAFAKGRYLPKDEQGNIGEVEQWSRHFGKAQAGLPAAGQVRSARMASAGAAKAWSETIFAEDSTAARAALRQLSIARIAAAGPKGVRSAIAIAKRETEAGQSLLRTIRDADRLLRESNASIG